MRYISDDGKVFNTEQECCEHEQKLEQEKIKKEKLEMEKQNRVDAINKKYEELKKMISEFKKDYEDTKVNCVSPFEEFARMVFGI